LSSIDISFTIYKEFGSMIHSDSHYTGNYPVFQGDKTKKVCHFMTSFRTIFVFRVAFAV